MARVSKGMLQRVDTQELRPQCADMLQEQLRVVSSTIDGAAAAFQQLQEVQSAVKSLAQPQPRSAHDPAVSAPLVTRELIDATHQLQQRLSSAIARLVDPPRSARQRNLEQSLPRGGAKRDTSAAELEPQALSKAVCTRSESAVDVPRASPTSTSPRSKRESDSQEFKREDVSHGPICSSAPQQPPEHRGVDAASVNQSSNCMEDRSNDEFQFETLDQHVENCAKALHAVQSRATNQPSDLMFLARAFSSALTFIENMKLTVPTAKANLSDLELVDAWLCDAVEAIKNNNLHSRLVGVHLTTLHVDLCHLIKTAPLTRAIFARSFLCLDSLRPSKKFRVMTIAEVRNQWRNWTQSCETKACTIKMVSPEEKAEAMDKLVTAVCAVFDAIIADPKSADRHLSLQGLNCIQKGVDVCIETAIKSPNLLESTTIMRCLLAKMTRAEQVFKKFDSRLEKSHLALTNFVKQQDKPFGPSNSDNSQNSEH